MACFWQWIMGHGHEMYARCGSMTYEWWICVMERMEFLGSHIFKEKIQHFCHVILEQGIVVYPNKIKAIIECPILEDVHNVLSFMG